MARIIDADKIDLRVPYSVYGNGEILVPLSAVKQTIAMTPTEDVERVVRCKDCMHGQRNNIGQLKGRYICEHHKDYKPMFSPYHFCGYGERKEQT